MHILVVFSDINAVQVSKLAKVLAMTQNTLKSQAPEQVVGQQ